MRVKIRMVSALFQTSMGCARAQSELFRRSGDPPRHGQRPLFMGVRDETVETPSETGAWSPERPRRTRSSTSGSGGASPPASMWLVGMLACRSGVSAVAVEALMDNVRKEGKLELIEAPRSSTAAEGIPEGFRSDESGRVAPRGTEATSPGTRAPSSLLEDLAAWTWKIPEPG